MSKIRPQVKRLRRNQAAKQSHREISEPGQLVAQRGKKLKRREDQLADTNQEGKNNKLNRAASKRKASVHSASGSQKGCLGY